MSVPPLSSSLVQLLWLVRIVEAGSFTEAARRAGTTPSAMSKAISRFEQAHGVRLLHRSTHSIALTDEGDRFLDEGRSILAELERAEASLAHLAGVRAGGRVRITAPTSFARSCIMPALPAFLRAHPEIEIELQFGNEIVDLAAAGIDIAIRSGSLAGLPGHVARRLCTFPWIACAATAYLEGRRTPETPADLAGHEHVAFRNRATGQILVWRFAAPARSRSRRRESIRVTPRIRHVMDDAESASNLVREGFGISWGPAWIGYDDRRAGRVVEILKDWRVDESVLSIVRLADRKPPERTRVVMDFLVALPSPWK